jgi:hypothetical protein
MQQAMCGLQGHDNLLQFERDRIFLKCATCGHESPGWALHETQAPVRADAEPRHAVVRPHFIGARRVA